MQIKLPDNVKNIIDKLCLSGYEAYAVGGCVRDSLMGKTPSDWDITTSALPEQIMTVFRGERIVPTGLKHGTVSIIRKGTSYEVTTYRIDGLYKDGRRPETVTFTGNIKEDLSRRDFTVNAMAYNDRSGLLDCFGGKNDLSKRLIRCVGEPEKRFSEDYLRMLRAYRFASVLDFDIDEKILSFCKENSENIKRISAERIREEFEKIITSGNARYIELFFRDFSETLFNEIYKLIDLEQNCKYHNLDVFRHTLKVLEYAACDKILCLAAILHDTGKYQTKTTDKDGETHFKGHEEVSAHIANDVMLRLKYDNKSIDEVVKCVRYHGCARKLDTVGIRRLINKIGHKYAETVLKFSICDLKGKAHTQDMLDTAEKRLQEYARIVERREPCLLKELKINGNEIMSVSDDFTGKNIGLALDYLMNKVLENPELNNRSILLDIAKEYAEKELFRRPLDEQV